MTASRKRSRPHSLDHEPEAVTWARKSAGLTKRALAEKVGISEQLMSEIESGWRNATPSNLTKIAEALKCPRVVFERQHTDAGRSIGQRLDMIEAVLFALARAQGIDPPTVG